MNVYSEKKVNWSYIIQQIEWSIKDKYITHTSLKLSLIWPFTQWDARIRRNLRNIHIGAFCLKAYNTPTVSISLINAGCGPLLKLSAILIWSCPRVPLRRISLRSGSTTLGSISSAAHGLLSWSAHRRRAAGSVGNLSSVAHLGSYGHQYVCK